MKEIKSVKNRMKRKMLFEIIKKLVLSCLLIVGICFVMLSTSLFLIGDTLGLIIGLILAFIMFLVIIIRLYPTWFKDYIDYYWEKQKELKENKKTVDWDSYDQNGI